MGKKKKAAQSAISWNGILGTVWKALIVAAVLFSIGIFLGALIIYRGILPLDCIPVMLYIICGIEAFGTTALVAFLQKQRAFWTALVTQALFMVLLLLIGMMAYETLVNWLHFCITSVVVFAVVLVTTALCVEHGGGKKKKFKKNADRRLKKK